MCHLANFGVFDYEAYSVYGGEWVSFNPDRPHRVVPCILPMVLRQCQERDSHCLGLAALILQCHFVANAAGYQTARVPLVYWTGYQLYDHLGPPELEESSDSM